MYNKFVKKNETLNLNLKQFIKLRAFWDEFVQYKTLEESEERAIRNNENASKKTYHHHMGSGGYKSVVHQVGPKTIAKNWSEHSKHWFCGHGGSVDPDTWALVWGQEISRAAERLVRAREAVQPGDSGLTGRKMNSRMRLKILSTVGIREGMGQFHGYIHSKLIRKPTEAARERRMRRQSGSAGWKLLLCSHKSARNLVKNGCRRRLKGKYKKHLVK